MCHQNLNDRKKIKQFGKKILINLVFLFFFRLGALTPLADFLKIALLSEPYRANKNISLEKIKNVCFIKNFNSVNLFCLGIIPYINALFFVNALATVSEPIKKLQENGGSAKKTLEIYTKKLAFFISVIHALVLLLSLGESFSFKKFFPFMFSVGFLTAGSIATIAIKEIISSKGIGSGVSQILFMKIILDFLEKDNIFLNASILQTIILSFFLLFFFFLQKIRVNIRLVSSSQLLCLEEMRVNVIKNSKAKNFFPFKKNELSLKLNQVGLLPAVIALSVLNYLPQFEKPYLIAPKYFFFSFFIITFNYLYTSLFWSPEKLANQLAKVSASIINIEPGKETEFYFKKIIKFSSLISGLLLCLIMICYDLVVKNCNLSFLKRINIISLLMLAELAFDIQKSLYYFEDELIKKI